MSVTEFKRSPCPICNHIGWCGQRDDGLVLCKRSPSPPEVAGYLYKGLAKDGQTAMYVEAGREHRQSADTHRESRGERRPAATPTPVSDLNEAFAAAVAAFSPDCRAALAAELGLPEGAMGELPIGWSDRAQHHGDHSITGAFILPEYDGQGRLIGVTYRFPAAAVADRQGGDGKPLGTKSAPVGLKRGLTLPAGWREMSDPVLVVEGPSDVLAGRAVGLSVIGRPSNVGGADLLGQLCRHRQVIVLGENDRKGDGRWPGKEGAELVARRLEATLKRPVPVALPPNGIKDLRDWVRQSVADWQAADLMAIRETILSTVQPPHLILLAEPPDRRGRVTTKAFRWSDGADGVALHADRLHLDDAAARRRFARAVARIEPDVDIEEFAGRLLALQPPNGPQHRPSSPSGSKGSSRAATAESGGEVPAPSAGNLLPVVFLPGGPTSIIQSATALGGFLAQTNKYYLRGGTTVTVGKDPEGQPILEVVLPAALASLFETVATLRKHSKENGVFVAHAAVASEQDAKLIQYCAAFRNLVPPVFVLSRCPVLIERDGALVHVAGYDRPSGILAFGSPALDIPLNEAVTLLLEMLDDFQFATPGDRARALAAVITPALVFGGLLGGRAPIDLGEADSSQSGKGYRAKLTAAVYNSMVKTVTQKKGGVGSLEESFASALVQGHNFISFDNIRSAIDSPSLESCMTEDSFSARVPHLAAIDVDPRRVFVQMTSNKADITIDLANRSSCVRILKQPEDYRFRHYAEGDILDHVRANQSLYLGAVFAVVKAWHQAGRPRTDATGHDFRPWARTLDWIVQHLFGAGPLLEGHRETQVRMSTPVLNWLRDVALAVRQADEMNIWLRASALLDLIADRAGIDVPGLTDGADPTDDLVRRKALQAIGRRLSQCFGGADERVIDGLRVLRRESNDAEGRTVRDYLFAEVAPADSPPYGENAYSGAIAGDDRRIGGNDALVTAGSRVEPVAGGDGVCPAAAPPYSAPYTPANRPAIEMAEPAMPAKGRGNLPYADVFHQRDENSGEILPPHKNIPGVHSGHTGTALDQAVVTDDEEVVVI